MSTVSGDLASQHSVEVYHDSSLNYEPEDSLADAVRDEAVWRTQQALLLGPTRPRAHKVWQRKYVKILVVGDSGLGKTTLVRALLSVPGHNLQLHDGTETSQEQFLGDPESLCSTVTWEDEEDKVVWIYKVQDTPGYGDELNIMNNIHAMIHYVEDQNYAWLDMELDRKRQVDLTEAEDPRVDVCVFCLQPHRLRPIDLRFMAELGKVVPIVPVVTKADTMTIKEAATFRQDIFTRLQNPNVGTHKGVGVFRGPINVFQFSDATRARAGLTIVGQKPMPPFLVVASSAVNAEMAAREPPVFWPERRYPWGVSEAFNPGHSDLLHLRVLLLKEGCEEIAAAKRARYHQWRRRVLSRRIDVRTVWRCLIGLALVTAGVGAVVSRSGLTGEDMKDLLQDRTSNALRWVFRRPHKRRPSTMQKRKPEVEVEAEVHQLEQLSAEPIQERMAAQQPRKKFLGIF